MSVAQGVRDERAAPVDRRWSQIGGAAGLLFAVTVIAGGVVEGTVPDLNSSVGKLTAFVLAHRHGLIASGILGDIAMAFVLVFVATVVHLTARPGTDADPLPQVVGYTGTATAVSFGLVPLPATALAIMAAQPGGLQDASLVRALLDLSSMTEGLFHFMAIFLVLSLGAVMVRRGLLGMWFGLLAAVVAVVTAVGAVVAMSVANGGAMSATKGASGFGLTLLIVIVSVTMLRGPAAAPAGP